MTRLLALIGLTVGAAALWLALDPPAPRPASANSSIPPAARTAAPGEGNCTQCHSGNALNVAGGSVTIADVPANYTPGETYVLTVTVQRPGQLRWGFELTALRSNGLAAGTFSNLTPLTGTQAFNGRFYVNHTTVNGQDGTLADSTSGHWQFNWTAPVMGTGTATFYATGNAADGNGSSLPGSGTSDFIYSTTATSQEAAATAVDATTWGKIKMLYR